MAEGETLLVSGASGFLGAHLVATASAAGWDVVGLRHRSDMPVPWPARTRMVAADLCDGDALERAIESAQPSAVIHAAAMSRMADCERDPAAARRVNVDGSRILAGLCAARGARFVHVSTDLVFGANAAPQGGFSEDDRPGPISVYGASKWDSELAVARADPRALIVRLPLLLGPSHGRGLGASDSVGAAVERGETPALFEDEWRTPLDVRSAARALLELVQSEACGPLHVAGPERMSRYELGLRALRQRGLRADQARKCIARSTRQGSGLEHLRPADVALNSARARSFLTTILVGLEDGST